MRALAQRHVGTDEDEVATLTFDHARQYCGGQPVGPDQMDLDLRCESFGVDFVQFPEVGIARSGDQNLDFAELLGGPVDESLDRVGVGDVERQCDRLAARGLDLVGQFLALVDTPGTQRHREAMGGKLDRGGRSDARRRARDDRGSAGRMWFEPGHLADLHGDRQLGEPADVAGVDAHGVGLVDRVAADSPEQFGQRHPGLHPG